MLFSNIASIAFSRCQTPPRPRKPASESEAWRHSNLPRKINASILSFASTLQTFGNVANADYLGIAFAKELEDQLPAATSKPQGSLFNNLQKHLSAFPSSKSLGSSASSKCEEIDGNGTSLWNLCTRLRRNLDSDNPQDVPIILVMARVFAFLLLDFALETGKSTASNVVRLMKIGIKAAKNCIESKEFDLALKALEKSAAYEVKLRKPDADISPEDGEVSERLIAEYYVLRTALAWHQDQLDMAEYMYNKSIAAKNFFNPNTSESLADVLFEMGKSLLEKQQYQMATKWLDRSYEVLNGQELDRLSMDASELRISIVEASVKSLLGLKEATSAEKARGLVNLLESQIGDKMIVLLLKLELLSAVDNEIFDSNAYCDILQRISRTMVFTESNFKLVMYHIRKLNDKSPSLACTALDNLLQLRVLNSERDCWIEKVLVTRLWMTVGQRDSVDAIDSLETILASIYSNLNKPLSATVTLAAQTLLWKRIESNYAQKQYDATEKWCRLAMHQIFSNSGDLNLARISRKLLLCAIAKHDFNCARDVFGSMSELAKNEPMTRFLMYKIAIRCNESEFAAECLDIVSHLATTDTTLLYACVLDAQQIGNRAQAVAALQLVLEKNPDSSGIVHLPSLLRITIKLASSILDNSESAEGSDEYESGVDRLCTFFEAGVNSVQKKGLQTQAVESSWSIPELDWFSKNSYNLAIKHISAWTPRNILRMLVSCIAFIDQYPSDISEQVSEDLSLRKIFCEFSASTALVALARAEDVIEEQLQHYLNLRKHVDIFDNLLQDKLGKVEDEPAEDLLRKFSILLGFDFEAGCQLKAWDNIGDVVRKADVCKNTRLYEVMADCVLSSQAPTQVLIGVLKKIVNRAWELKSLDSTKLAKYMRCLFQVALADSPDIAESLLEQVCDLAENTSETELPYPTEELEWIATRAFNHAIDLYCNDQDQGCRNWASKAMNIAHFCRDSGALENQLQTKWLGLKFAEN